MEEYASPVMIQIAGNASDILGSGVEVTSFIILMIILMPRMTL